MTAKEYAEYESSVADFFAREGIENMSTGHITCPECKVEWDDTGQCPDCGQSRECADEPYFSWSHCDCCARSLGGNREHATGYHRERDEIYEYEICEDCAYYTEYGVLDDTTMNEVNG